MQPNLISPSSELPCLQMGVCAEEGRAVFLVCRRKTVNVPLSPPRADSESANRVFLLSWPFPVSFLSLDKSLLAANVCETHCCATELPIKREGKKK